ncbi:MAG TPA: protoheme IX farnesyltransferase [Xanthomonadales bacterium]|nr:protoheme IX farnesyltransferase [Xanthomonadales bacterium]
MRVMTSSFGQFWQLTKPRVVALIVFTAVVGMFLARLDPRHALGMDSLMALFRMFDGDLLAGRSGIAFAPSLPPWPAVLFGGLGIWLAAASAAAINHLLDRRIDAVMARTAARPLPSGGLSTRQVLVFALVLGVGSMVLLVWLVNPLTAVLTFASLIGYALIYTGFLKRATPQNIVIGGLAGAAPPALGWTAVTDQLHPYALLLVLIIFVWTPPHFWALAIFRRDDYAKAMIPMLPVVYGVVYTRWQILFYTLLLVAVTVLPWATGMSGPFYLGGALVLGAVFVHYAIRLLDPPGELYAMRVFSYSVIYLMALFGFLLVDWWLLAV